MTPGGSISRLRCLALAAAIVAVAATGCAGGNIDVVFTLTPTPSVTSTSTMTVAATPTLVATSTPTEVPTPTSAFRDRPGSQIYASGVGRLRGTFCFDLDAGAEAPCAGPAHDLWWRVTDVERYLVPESGAKLAVWGQVPPSREDCAGSALVATPVDGSDSAANQLLAGTYVCAHTSEGRTAALRVITYGSDLVFEYLVWAVAP